MRVFGAEDAAMPPTWIEDDPDHAQDLACSWCFAALKPHGLADPTGQLTDGSWICDDCVKSIGDAP